MIVGNRPADNLDFAMPKPPDDPLLGANAFQRDDSEPPAPPKVVRTPTRKERMVVIPAKPLRRPRSPTLAETAMPETDEIVPGFRPRQRPSMALLTIYDDGRAAGEVVRLRDDLTVIGRAQGEVVIPHDNRMSSKHAEICRSNVGGAWQWVLTDLNSTNGTFVRVHKCSIKSGQELLIGHRRFRFEDTSANLPPAPTGAKTTVAWAPPAAAFVAENWIGRAADCTIPLDDPMIADHHVRLIRGDSGWKLESHEARDGVWFRIDKPITVDRTCSFQLGEQRFLLRVL